MFKGMMTMEQLTDLQRLGGFGLRLAYAALFMGLIGVGWCAPAQANDKADYQVGIKETVTKVFSGEITTMSPRIDPHYIGVSSDKEDSFFRIDEDIEVEHKKDMNDISLGDRISVTYDEITEVTEEGRELTKRVARTVRFVGPATRRIRVKPGATAESQAAEEPVLRSAE